MESESVIFSSKITRCNNDSSRNNLSELLQIAPAIPISRVSVKQNVNDYKPTIDSSKYYIPKKKSGLKVKTVRNIRNVFEQDVYSYLPVELEKQRNILLKKIRHGYSRDAQTREIAKNTLKGDTPISKSAWHMLMNINPDDNAYSFQYILWNGKFIQVNGSKGGKSKFMSKYDVGKILRNNIRSTYVSKVTMPLVKKKGLLQNSLNVKFKPGPLTRKKYLDTSYQKHQFGDMELVSLPKAGLEIQTAYGKPLGPIVNTFLYNNFMQESNCVVSEKWAEFAVSVLGSNVKGDPSQSASSLSISFDLGYKCLQNRILMRRDIDTINSEVVFYNTLKNDNLTDDSVIFCDVERVLNDMIQAVDISLNQDNMYTGVDEQREDSKLNNSVNQNHQSKNKSKRKYCELDRLDVTIIRITESSDKNKDVLCNNASCALGCVCSSLKCDYKFKNHCGQIGCMFECKCDISSYKFTDFIEDCSDILPGLVSIEKKTNTKLSKEEQKFHQTVIVTNEKSILLKSRKRDWKASKKYADFFTHMRLKPDPNLVKELSVVALKLNCDNIEPWCMVHNLYKCFCKGKFTTTVMASLENTTINETSEVSVLPKSDFSCQEYQNDSTIKCVSNNIIKDDETKVKRSLRQRTRQSQRKLSERSISDSSETFDTSRMNYCYNTCARIKPYKGRKYKDSYYSETNLKVSEMEKNDKNLLNKLLSIVNKIEIVGSNIRQDSAEPETFGQVSTLKELLTNVIEENTLDSSTETSYVEDLRNPSEASSRRLSHRTKIISWLELSYKKYKLRAAQGMFKSSLDPPQAGKMALYPWDFILSRYRERKNHFLVSNHKPIRIFMAVDIKKCMFEKCINIRDIALCDLDKYPLTVRNLVSNATDLLDNFCILYGLEYYWELIGSVTKVGEPTTDNNDENFSSDINISLPGNAIEFENQKITQELDDFCNNVTTEKSKWFLMTIENDFSEIQFYQKGFFVKYDSVIKAINVARASGKTVRLSAQKYDNQHNEAQFGIYAIPNHKSYCVFIGPYDKDEKLGIETVSKCLKFGNNRTRGIWITTNKVDDVKVIENPLSFMSSANIGNEKLIPLESSDVSSIKVTNPVSLNTNKKNEAYERKSFQTTIKAIEKTRKANKLVLRSSEGLSRQAQHISSDTVTIAEPTATNTSNIIKDCTANELNKLPCITTKTFSLMKTQKPIAEIAPQLKTYNNKSMKKKYNGGMFILNPDEINKRSFDKACNQNSSESLSETNTSDIINLDIENFLATSIIRPAPSSDIYVISDDEDQNLANKSYIDVYIVCQNIKNLGWIPGKRNSDLCLSFTFPGFKETEFYPEEEAFEKINQVMSRKVYIPKWITLEWQVCHSFTDIRSKPKLESKDLQSDYVMTKQGLRHKSAVSKNINNSQSLLLPNTISTVVFSPDFFTQKESLLENLESTSTALENESQTLIEETILKKDEISETLIYASDDKREEYSETLNNMLWYIDTEVTLGDT